jgi:hypothetical protein
LKENKNICRWLSFAMALMMETGSIFETSVSFYNTTRRNTPEDSHLYTRRHENLKSHKDTFYVPSVVFPNTG